MKQKTIRHPGLVGKDEKVNWSDKWKDTYCSTCGASVVVLKQHGQRPLEECAGCFAQEDMRSAISQTVYDNWLAASMVGHPTEGDSLRSLAAWRRRWPSLESWNSFLNRQDAEWLEQLDAKHTFLLGSRGEFVTQEASQEAFDKYKATKEKPSRFITNTGRLDPKKVAAYGAELDKAYGRGPRKQQQGWVGGAGKTQHNASSRPSGVKFLKK